MNPKNTVGNRTGLKGALAIMAVVSRGELWSRDELVVVLDLYVRKGHAKTDPEVKMLARLTGRTEYSIGMRMGNFMHVDPQSPNEGMFGGRAQCEPLFNEFAGKPLLLAREAEQARLRLADKPKPQQTPTAAVTPPIRTRTSAPQLSRPGDGIVEYANTRLHFNANRIEPLGWDEAFRVKTPFGIYQMTKRQFYEAFPNIVKTQSYLVGRHYHSATPHLQAERFKVG